MRYPVIFLIYACVTAEGLIEGDVDNVIRFKDTLFPPIPDFVNALKLFQRNAEAFESLLPHSPLSVTDFRRHYVIIAGVLAVVVEYMNSDCTTPDYSHQFAPVVDRVLPVFWENPKLAVDKLEQFLKDANASVSRVQDIVDYYCKQVRPTACNAVILAIGNMDMDSLELVILLGELGAMYEQNPFVQEAKDFNEVAFLLREKMKLKPLVMKAVEVYNKLYGTRCVLR